MKNVMLVLVVFLCGCVEIGLGVARVGNVPESHMSGSEQFHISVSHRYNVSEKVVIETQWHHFSNGAHIGIGNFPNKGLDFYGSQVKYSF